MLPLALLKPFSGDCIKQVAAADEASVPRAVGLAFGMSLVPLDLACWVQRLAALEPEAKG